MYEHLQALTHVGKKVWNTVILQQNISSKIQAPLSSGYLHAGQTKVKVWGMFMPSHPGDITHFRVASNFKDIYIQATSGPMLPSSVVVVNDLSNTTTTNGRNLQSTHCWLAGIKAMAADGTC